MPQRWKKQTIIGLVKSRYCAPFFEEYGQTIIGNESHNDFINIVNLYAFEINPISKLFSYVHLRPCGAGRASLIRLIIENNLYAKDEIPTHYLEKLCTDYSNSQNKEKQDAENASIILVHILEKVIAETDTNGYYMLSNDINRLLVPIYQMAKYTGTWIKGFWDDLTVHYKSNNKEKAHLAEEIIEDTLGYQHIELAIHLPTELCELAEMYWTHSPTTQPRHSLHPIFENERNDISYFYGLSEQAKHYDNDSYHKDVLTSSFFYALFMNNFWIGLEWAISLVNNAVSHFSNYTVQHGEGLPFYELYFVESNTKRSYIGSEDMWLVTIGDHRMPKLIGDLIYCLKEAINTFLKADSIPENEKVEFAENIKRCLYEKSNNTALLTAVADIGIAFRKDLPGFALDLATSIDIIFDDLRKLSIIKKDPTRDMLEQQILLAMGIPSSILPDRYNIKKAEPFSLQMYVMDSQMRSEYIQLKCHRILDYLSSIISNDEENAVSHLQIQKMDLRDARIEAVDNATVAIIPTISGEAKKITENADKRSEPKVAVASTVHNIGKKMSDGKLSLSDCLEAIEEVQKAMKDDFESNIDNTPLLLLVATALINSELDKETRATFCRMWIGGIRSYFSSGSFIFEYGLSITLFKQIEFDICLEVKNEIKQLVLDLVLYNGQHGVINEIARIALIYLSTNEQLAKTMFNTVVKLAEDEMDHQKFNAEYIKNYFPDDNFEFIPNMQTKLWRVDSNGMKNDNDKYQSNKEEIIRKYLLNGVEPDLSEFDIDNYDVTTLYQIVNCGLPIQNPIFTKVMKKVLAVMIEIWKSNHRIHNAHVILGSYYHVELYLLNEFVKDESCASTVLNILFEDFDFSKFTHETIEFYRNIFSGLLADYFDSHSDKVRRAKCINIIKLLEEKVLAIKEEKIKLELFRSLIFSATKYIGGGDWSNFPAGYSYQDKQILNTLFSKYGEFHVKDMLYTLYKLQLGKLLPEILHSVNNVFENAKKTNLELFRQSIQSENEKTIVLMMIALAYLDFSDPIKKDEDLIKSFEGVLETLLELNFEEAATILDEFRVH